MLHIKGGIRGRGVRGVRNAMRRLVRMSRTSSSHRISFLYPSHQHQCAPFPFHFLLLPRLARHHRQSTSSCTFGQKVLVDVCGYAQKPSTVGETTGGGIRRPQNFSCGGREGGAMHRVSSSGRVIQFISAASRRWRRNRRRGGGGKGRRRVIWLSLHTSPESTGVGYTAKVHQITTRRALEVHVGQLDVRGQCDIHARVFWYPIPQSGRKFP